MDYEIKPSDLYSRLMADEQSYLVDLRDQDVYYEGHIPGALNIPSTRAQFGGSALMPDDGLIILYDEGPDRGAAEDTRKLLVEKGLQVQVLAGGYAAWIAAGYPVEKEPSG